MVTPLLSIVIANRNYGEFLEKAIQSVIEQDVGNLAELIICDAASTDNSVDIIKKYAGGLPQRLRREEWQSEKDQCANTNGIISWWCSEKDGGQSEAFNKGFSHAKGRFLTWLNADDILLPGAIKQFARAVNEYPSCKWFVAGVMWLDRDMNVIRCGRGRPFSKMRASTGDVNVWGPSSMFTKDLYLEAGGIDERFSFSMDTDLWLRFYFYCHETYVPYANYAWGFRIHEKSKTASALVPCADREREIVKAKRIREEIALRESKLPPLRKKSLWKKVISVSLWKSLMGRIDTIMYHGRNYMEYFK